MSSLYIRNILKFQMNLMKDVEGIEETRFLTYKAYVGWFVVLDLTALLDTVFQSISGRLTERETEKRKDR